MKSRARSSGTDSKYDSILPSCFPHLSCGVFGGGFDSFFLAYSDVVPFAVVGWLWCRLSVRKSKAEEDPNKPKKKSVR
jgi:hypothetical protein